MDCKHEKIRCTNCVKFCMICGQKLPDCAQPIPSTGEEEKAVEPQKTGRKRKARKEMEA